MLHAPTNDRKTKPEASPKTVEHLSEQEQTNNLLRSRQSHPMQQRENLAAMQNAYGNQALLRMKGRSPSINPTQGTILQRKCACGGTCTECQTKQGRSLQTKLSISEPGDRYEQEADRVAEQVMAIPTHSAVSKALPHIQRFTRQTIERENMLAPVSVDRVLSSHGNPLEPSLKQDMEQRFGHDFSRVRVHTDTEAEQSALEVNANAYTVGNNIVFGAGKFSPRTQEGAWLLAHELTHVVQQSNLAGVNLNQSIKKSGFSQIVQRQESGVDVDSDSEDQSLAILAAEEPEPITTTDIVPLLAGSLVPTGTGTTADITLETGNSTGNPINNAVHQQICIHTPLSDAGKRCFSFGATGFQSPQFSSTWLGWSSTVVGAILQGEVYEAPPVSGSTINNTLTVTTSQSSNWLRYMVFTRLGLQDAYSIARHNCRAFSQWEFRDAPSHL